MSAMRKKVFLFLLFIIMAGITAFFYVNNFLLPIKGKQFLIHKAEKFLQRKVSVGEITFNPTDGIIITNFIIYAKDSATNKILEIKKATVSFLVIPFFHKNAIIIPSFYINGLKLKLVKNKDGWNLEDILQRKSEQAGSKYTILIRKISIKNSSLDLVDYTKLSPLSVSIKNISLNTILSLDRNVYFNIKGDIPKDKAIIRINGKYNIADRNIDIHTALSNIYIAQYIYFLPKTDIVRIQKGILSSADMDLSYMPGRFVIDANATCTNTRMLLGKRLNITGQIKITGAHIVSGERGIIVTGEAALPRAQLSITKKLNLKGNIHLRLDSFHIRKNTATILGILDINQAKLALSKDKFFSGDLKVSNISIVEKNGKHNVSGNISLKNAIIQWGEKYFIKGDINAQQNKITLFGKNINISSSIQANNAFISIDNKLRLSANILANNVYLSFFDKKLSLKAKGLQLNNTKLITNNIQFTGNPKINIFFQHNPNPKITKTNKYSGRIYLSNANIQGLPIVKKADMIQGVITLEENKINIDEITLHILGSNARLSAEITDLANPYINASAELKDISLRHVQNTILEITKTTNEKKYTDSIFNNINISGKADIKLKYNGLIKSPANANTEANVILKNAIINASFLPSNITQIYGQINYTKETLIAKDIKCLFKNTKYTLNSKLENFSIPNIEAKLISKDLNLFTNIKPRRKFIKINTLNVKYKHSTFNVQGDIRLTKYSSPELDIKTNFNLNSNDIKKASKKLGQWLNKADVNGNIYGNGLFKGSIKDWKNWQTAFNIQSDFLSIMGYPFKNIIINYAQRDKRIDKINILSNIYNGALSGSSSIDLSQKNLPANIIIKLEGMDIEKFCKGQNLKRDDLKGKLSVLANLHLPITDLQAVSGKATISITNGFLGKIKIIKGVLATINNIPGYIGKILSIFTNEQIKTISKEYTNYITGIDGEFLIKDREIYTDNLRLLGSIYDLKVAGIIDFDKHIKLTAYPDYQRFLNKSKYATEFIGTPVYVEITGDIDNPKFKPIINPTQPLEKAVGTTLDIFKGVGDILQDIF